MARLSVIERAFDPVLHHQGGRQGHRPGAQPGLWLYPPIRRACARSRSGTGQGACVELYLPRHGGDGTAGRARCSPDERRRLPPGRPDQIVLVVEDEAAVRRHDRRCAARRSATPSSMPSDGERGAGANWRRSRPHVDLLLTDVVMPEMNGRANSPSTCASSGPEVRDAVHDWLHARCASPENGMLNRRSGRRPPQAVHDRRSSPRSVHDALDSERRPSLG